MRSDAEARLTTRRCRRSQATRLSERVKARPKARNGSPSPSENAARSTAPSAAPPVPAESVRIAASVGPTHGVQATAKATPTSAAAGSPTAPARPGLSRSSRERRPGSGVPTNVSAARMTKTPATISSGRLLARSASPNHAAPAPRATNITVKPATKAAVERVTVRGRLPSSSKPTPDTKER